MHLHPVSIKLVLNVEYLLLHQLLHLVGRGRGGGGGGGRGGWRGEGGGGVQPGIIAEDSLEGTPFSCSGKKCGFKIRLYNYTGSLASHTLHKETNYITIG